MKKLLVTLTMATMMMSLAATSQAASKNEAYSVKDGSVGAYLYVPNNREEGPAWRYTNPEMANQTLKDSNTGLVPNTNAITAGAYLDVPSNGEAGPEWKYTNPNIVTKQTTSLGTYETFVDSTTGELVVKRDNAEVSTHKPYDISTEFNYD